MVERMSHSEEMTRSEMAAYLRSIADQIDSGESVVSVPLGNKSVRLSPSDSIDADATVTERSRRLRKDTEEVALTFKWNPEKDTAENNEPEAAEIESGPGSDSGR